MFNKEYPHGGVAAYSLQHNRKTGRLGLTRRLPAAQCFRQLKNDTLMFTDPDTRSHPSRHTDNGRVKPTRVTTTQHPPALPTTRP
ncbi:hypothetical protein BaRGS_00002001 [Batillaria attramentaria]|uniref:Uncharacterized protein n=1 Tax=Batillaria attramentaria TaxID=370345 RepID=A0ABD0M4R0_9CAEN